MSGLRQRMSKSIIQRSQDKGMSKTIILEEFKNNSLIP